MTIDLRKTIILAFDKNNSNVSIINENMEEYKTFFNLLFLKSNHILNSEKYNYIYLKMTLYEYEIILNNIENLSGLNIKYNKQNIINKCLFPFIKTNINNLSIKDYYDLIKKIFSL